MIIGVPVAVVQLAVDGPLLNVYKIDTKSRTVPECGVYLRVLLETGEWRWVPEEELKVK